MEINPANIHLMLNHIPTIGLLMALLIMLSSLFLNSLAYRQLALIIIIASGIFTVPVSFSGEEVEEIIEKQYPEKREYVHEHEETAEKATLFMYVLSIMAIVSYAANRFYWERLYALNYVTFIIGLFVLIWLGIASHQGAMIMHEEIR